MQRRTGERCRERLSSTTCLKPLSWALPEGSINGCIFTDSSQYKSSFGLMPFFCDVKWFVTKSMRTNIILPPPPPVYVPWSFQEACSRKISAGEEDFFQASCIISKVPVSSPSRDAYNWPMRAGSQGDECVPANNSSRQNSWGFIIMWKDLRFL